MIKEKQPDIIVMGTFIEAVHFTRALVEQKRMTPEEGVRLSNKAYRETAVALELGYPVDGEPEELPEHLRKFPGATRPDGTVIFSDSKT